MKLIAASGAVVVFASVLLISSMKSAQSQSTSTPNTSAWSFGGRPVIVEKKGVHFGVSEHAKLEPSESAPQFVVIRIKTSDSTSYDYWQPLSDISNIKVFDSLEDAREYEEKHSPGR